MFYVDMPNSNSLDGSWVSVGQFETKQEALAFIREKIGECDKSGNINLLTEMPCEWCGGSGVRETELYEGLVNCPECSFEGKRKQ